VITSYLLNAGGRVAQVELRPEVYNVFAMAGFTNTILICISREESVKTMQ
jgi:hypothetical protein